MGMLKQLAPALLLTLAVPLGSAGAQYNQGGGQPQGGYNQGGYNQGGGQQQGGWDAVPSDYGDELRQRAFHDGIEGARADFANHVQSGPEQHDEFRHPKVPFLARDTYREAYKRGYFTAVKHMQEHREGDRPQGGYQPQPGGYQQQGGWDAPPSEYGDDLQRHAFHDGIEAARADVSNRVQPNPEGHEEFRHPQVPFPARDSYREAYKRGYFMAVRHMQEQGR